MIKQNQTVEVLAPAGSPSALEAAVACGADAVYLGIDCLNARRNAENFTRETLAETVRRCHIRGVKVYLTLNIVVLENEIPQLLEAAACACAAGVDAVIVQDLGAAAILRRCCPSLKLNASTQMAVHNPEGVKLLQELGFSRAVLARECSRAEIAAICAATDLEIEAFVHGALCMSVSGQCYMSAVLGQRSGNRGLCAQPCRLAFESTAATHALSLKDMSLIPRMDELRAAGVTSIKIEGRMKRPEYVAAAVTACRVALAGGEPDMESLQAVFSRSGFTDGYFEGKRTLSMFGTREKEDVTAAAGVLGKLENLYTDPRKQVQKVGVELAFAMKPEQPSFLSVLDSDGNSVCAEGDIPQVARNLPTDEERAKQNLEKTGGTPYRVESLRCSISPGLMLPASALNALRRKALEALDEVRGTPRALPFDAAQIPPLHGVAHKNRPALRVRLDRASQLSMLMTERAELITLPVPVLLQLLADGVPEYLDKLCAGIPRMLFSGQAELRAQMQALRAYGVCHASAGNLGALELAREFGFTVHGEPFLNIVNSYAAQTAAQLGASDLVLSFELSLDAARRMQSPVPVGLTAYGNLPLMTVRNCPVRVSAGCDSCRKGAGCLTDRRGNILRTDCAYGCAELLNPVPLYMADRLDELKGIDFLELRFTLEHARDCGRIFAEYLDGGSCDGKFTRGLLYKTIF